MSATNPAAPSWISVRAYAAALAVHPTTVLRWIRAGKLDHIRTPTGRIRVASHQSPNVQQSQTPQHHATFLRLSHLHIPHGSSQPTEEP